MTGHREGRLRVAIDAGPVLDPRTGIGRYARELLDGLESFGVDVRPYAYSLTGPSSPRVRRSRIPARLAQASWQRWDRPRVARLTGEVDVVHGTNFVLPATAGVPGVVTVHDLTFMGDHVFPGGERLRALVPWSVERAARIIVPTNAIAEELARALEVDPARIHVTPEGVSPVFFGATPLADAALEERGIRPPFALAVGTIEPRKNLRTLLDAWGRAGLDGWTLVLAGPKGWGPELPETAGVKPIGWVGDETLPGLLASASFFCYPSLYEGFGLPPLEAMAAGTAVVAGRYSAAPEVLGEAALLVEPGDIDALAGALVSLATDDALRGRLQRAGKARATTFTWSRTVKETVAAYKAALEV